MLAEITAMQLLCLRLSELADDGRLTAGMASLAKMNHAAKAREIVGLARHILGGNGILLENHVARQHADMEAIFTFEGTDSIQSLIVAREITGLNAIGASWARPASPAQPISAWEIASRISLREGRQAGDGLAEDQRVHLVRALVGEHGLEVVRVAQDRILERDAVGAEHRPGRAGDLHRRADVVVLAEGDLLRAQR